MAKNNMDAFMAVFPEDDRGERSARLYSDEGGSDKVYNVFQVASGSGYVLNFNHGPRNGTLKAGTKTPAPVTLEVVRKEFYKLVASKMNGSSHYRCLDTPIGAYVEPVAGRVRTGIDMMFPVSADAADVEAMLTSDLYLMQEKMDGEHFAGCHKGNEVIGSNKLGFQRGIPRPVSIALDQDRGVTLDGELIGDTLHVFDILAFEGADVRHRACHYRVALMEAVVNDINHHNLRIVPTYRTTEEKRAAYEAIRAHGGEGVVFKHINSTYVAGKNPATGVLKHKFVESATLLVCAISATKRSVQVGAYDADGQLVTMCSVTIPPNANMPNPGDLAEVQYLYAFPASHALAQPIWKGLRNDQTPAACVLAQLKYKPITVRDDEDQAEQAPMRLAA